MATQTRQVFDGKGNFIRMETYEVPPEVLVLEQAQARLRALKAKGRLNWTSSDLSDIAEALLQLMGV